MVVPESGSDDVQDRVEDKPGQDDECNPSGDQLEETDGINPSGSVAGLPAGTMPAMDLVFRLVMPGFFSAVFHDR